METNYLLDTNICISILKNKNNTRQKVAKVAWNIVLFPRLPWQNYTKELPKVATKQIVSKTLPFLKTR